MRKDLSLVLILLASSALAVAQTPGARKRAPRPDEFGNVVMDNFAGEGSDPVVFSHWLHRAKYTCRLCHVDLGFAMSAGETGVMESDNSNGLYCGACHNGEVAFATDEKAKDGSGKNCLRCHAGGSGQRPEMEHDFYEFVKGFPRARYGNRVDWMKAEEQGLVKLEDFLEGVSIEKRELQRPEETTIHAKVEGMPNILFSHEKHSVWNGCELCHPQIFGIRRRAIVYDMQDIFDGKFCGACHDKVAFPNTDCQLCHTEEVF